VEFSTQADCIEGASTTVTGAFMRERHRGLWVLAHGEQTGGAEKRERRFYLKKRTPRIGATVGLSLEGLISLLEKTAS